MFRVSSWIDVRECLMDRWFKINSEKLLTQFLWANLFGFFLHIFHRITSIQPWILHRLLLGCWHWTTCFTWPNFIRTPISGYVKLLIFSDANTSAALLSMRGNLFLQIVLENSSREDKHECPFGRSAIELTRMLCEILQVGELRKYHLLPSFTGCWADVSKN